VEALERLGFTGFISNKSFLPFVFGAGEGTRTPIMFYIDYYTMRDGVFLLPIWGLLLQSTHTGLK
jgi:hypothetical protein